MAEFYYETYVQNYEIDLYNDITEEERKILKSKNIEPHTYFLSDGKWCQRLSGMTYNLKHLPFYNELQEYLNERFKIFSRKIKLDKLNGELQSR